MKRLIVVLAVLVAAGFAVNASASPAKTIRRCIPNKQAGIDRIGNVTLIVYCGSAKATQKSGSAVTALKGGMCLKTAGNLILGFGKYTALVSPTALSNAWTLVVPAAGDGTSRFGQITVQKKGAKAAIAANVKVVVVGKRSRGTFSGKFLKGAKFTGSFTCK